MKLLELVETSKQVGATRGRRAKVDGLASLLRRVPDDEIEIAVRYLAGTLRQGRIGVGPALVWGLGDRPGAAASSLELIDVDRVFDRLAAAAGRGSGAARAALLDDLFRRATSDEQAFLSRLCLGEMRQGALEALLLEAVARAAALPADRVRRAVMLAGDLAPVAHTLLLEGEPGLARFAVRLLQPVKPMLAETAAGIDDALARLGTAAFEYKLDGARIQVHKSGDTVCVFTRHLRDVTAAVPEIVDAVRRYPAYDLILDGEVLALQPDGAPQPFQVTMRRFGRKLEVDRLRGEVPLTPFFFDCLYANGQVLIDEPQARRAHLLAEIVPASQRVSRVVASTVSEAAAVLEAALRAGHEGLVAKGLDAPYAAGSRGAAWLKIKVAQSLDLVVLAAEWGHGRRKGFLSNLHLGARDPEHGTFVMLGKTFKGLTDELLRWQTRTLLELEVARDGATVHVRPDLVVEVAFNELQTSPQYPGGLALRFARVKRYRPDKAAAEADTIGTVREIHRRARTAAGLPPA